MAALTQEVVRRCLYPKLEDHECVREYPSVRGMAKDTWFLHHTNKEAGGGDDAVSKCNMFEVLFYWFTKRVLICHVFSRWKWS
jgi:hypothetical protein